MTRRLAGEDAIGSDPVGERLLRSATRLFYESGFEGTSVSSIAQAAGVTAAAVYYHYPSKMDVLLAVLESEVGQGFRQIESSVTATDPPGRLAQYVEAFIEQQMVEADSRNFGYSSLVASLPTSHQQAAWRLGRPYMDLLRTILAQGRESGDFDFDDLAVTAFAISTVCEYVFTWYSSEGPRRADVVKKQYSELVLRMVQRPSDG